MVHHDQLSLVLDLVDSVSHLLHRVDVSSGFLEGSSHCIVGLVFLMSVLVLNLLEHLVDLVLCLLVLLLEIFSILNIVNLLVLGILLLQVTN